MEVAISIYFTKMSSKVYAALCAAVRIMLNIKTASMQLLIKWIRQCTINLKCIF